MRVFFFLVFTVMLTVPAQAQFPSVQVNSDSFNLQNEPYLAVSPDNPDDILAVWRDFRLGYRRVAVGVSRDGGEIWEDFLIEGPPQYPRQSDPFCLADENGTYYVMWLALNETSFPQAVYMMDSSDLENWSEPRPVFDYNEYCDKEWFALDQSGGAYHGRLYCVSVVTSSHPPPLNGTYLYYSDDGGVEWNLSASELSLSWPWIEVDTDGNLIVSGRYYDETGSSNSLVVRVSLDGGLTFSEPDSVAPMIINGARYNCNGVQISGYGGLAVDRSPASVHYGRIYLTYFHFADAPADSTTDIFCLYSDDAGNSWSEPVRVNDDPPDNRLDQWMPIPVVDDAGGVHVTFYDRRCDPAHNLLTELYCADSFDGGMTFTNRLVGDTCFVVTETDAGTMGEYNRLLQIGNDLGVVSADCRYGTQDIRFCRFPRLNTSVEDAGDKIMPTVFTVFPGYPNPFNSSTNIRFNVNRRSPVEITILNALGQKVSLLYNGDLSGGEHLVRWDAGDFSSGVYYTKICSRGRSEIRRIMLIK